MKTITEIAVEKETISRAKLWDCLNDAFDKDNTLNEKQLQKAALDLLEERGYSIGFWNRKAVFTEYFG